MLSGTHPFEKFSQQVADTFGQWRGNDVEIIGYTPPTLIGYSGKGVAPVEHERLTDKGMKEIRAFLNQAYPNVGCVIDLHDPAGDVEDYQKVTGTHLEQFGLEYPGSSKRLERVLKAFKESVEVEFPHTQLMADFPRAFANRRSLAVELCYDIINYEGRRLRISVDEGVCFLSRLIDYLDRNYLIP